MLYERIESLEDHRLDVYRNLKTQNTLRDQRVFIAEGPTVVERVLRSEFVVRSLLISDRKFAHFAKQLPVNVPVYRLSNELASSLVGFNFHCGVMACAERKPVPPISTWFCGSRSQLILAGDRIVDPENVGALIRIASAFGAAAVILGKGSADAFSRRVLRVSMGNVLFVPVIETEDLPAYLSELKENNQCEVVSTVLDQDATSLDGYPFPERTVLVMGNEFDGVSTEVRSLSSTLLTIPMLNKTDSLNVAVSSGIFLYQFRCQHTEC